MQWIGDPNADNAFLEACNKWDNFKGIVLQLSQAATLFYL